MITVEIVNSKNEVLYAFEGFEVDCKSEDELFIQGYISTTDVDKVNDIVTNAGQDDLTEQLKSMSITMDLDHETFRDENGNSKKVKSLIPVAKIVESKREEKGTFVKALINNAHPSFKSISESIKKGFLHSFSIAYVPVKAVTRIIDGVKTRLLDKVNLLNVAITGVPVNPNATFSIVTKSFIGSKMVEEKNLETQMTELKSVVESKEKEIAELKSVISAKDTELAELKSVEQKNTAEVKSFGAEIAELKSKLSGFDEVKLQVAELKSVLEKVRATPIYKAQVEAKSMTLNELKGITPIEFISKTV